MFRRYSRCLLPLVF